MGFSANPDKQLIKRGYNLMENEDEVVEFIPGSDPTEGEDEE